MLMGNHRSHVRWGNNGSRHTSLRARVWWFCKNGHKWQAAISSRAYGTGCPYCSGRYATPTNNLAVTHPYLAEQWHLTKNGNLTPLEVKSGSDKIVWWCCINGHIWQAAIKDRSRGTGCPHCYRENPSRARIQKLIQKGKQRTLD